MRPCSYNACVHALLADSPAATADYRRQARRIRASFDRDPFLRHAALSALASRQNALDQAKTVPHPRTRAVTARRVESPFPHPTTSATISTIEQEFSDQAAACLQPFGFTFSDRVRLLDSAERMGLPRFRANLLLAMREHQAPARIFAPPEVPSRSFAPSLLLILGIEILIVAGLIALCAW